MAHDKRGSRAMRCAGLCGVLLLGLGAHAQPLVRVQAGTQIVLHGMRSEDGLDLRGALLDDLGSPLAGRALTVRIAGDRPGAAAGPTLVRTAEDGTFRVTADVAAGAYRVLVRFAGDSHHAGSESAQDVDLSRADVRLAFIEPRGLRIDLDGSDQRIALRASSARGGGGLAVEVQDERGAAIARGTSDADGMLVATVPAAALGAPGHGKLVAHSRPDALRDGARAEVAVLRWRGTRVDLRSRADRTGGFVLEGLLRDSRAGLDGEAVGIFDGSTHLATVITDRAGRFRHEVASSGGNAGRTLRLQARFDSDAPWLGSSRSATVELALAQDTPLSPLWLLLPLCTSALLVWVLLRRPAADRAALATAAEAGIGIHPGRGRARGRAEQRRIAGKVRDAATERPVSGAALSLQSAAGARLELSTDTDGGFASDELDAGEWALTIGAEGYVTLSGTLAIPHRGEWADVVVKLQSLRSAAVAAYRPAALRLLPSAELWQRWTPRETLANAQQNGRATEPFVQLTQRVEHAAYARTPPSEEDVVAIERTANEALARFP